MLRLLDLIDRYTEEERRMGEGGWPWLWHQKRRTKDRMPGFGKAKERRRLSVSGSCVLRVFRSLSKMK